MRILIEIGHPAHVHFFERVVTSLKAQGHRVLVVTRNKDITNQLLDEFGLPYIHLSKPWPKQLLLLELLWRWCAIAFLIVKNRVDTVASISGISTSLPARLLFRRNIVFTDTEDAKISNLIAFPFADKILTPKFFLRELGASHVRYNGLHELSYLQKFDEAKASAKRKIAALPDRYFVVRTVLNDALHDSDIKGMNAQQIRELIQHLAPHGQVYLSCEGQIPKEFSAYRLPTALRDIHAVLAGALMFIGESPTMAVESSLLGTPAFLLSQRVRRLGNMVGLEASYGLLRNFERSGDLVRELIKINDFANLKSEWQVRARNFLLSSEPMDNFIHTQLMGHREDTLCAA